MTKVKKEKKKAVVKINNANSRKHLWIGSQSLMGAVTRGSKEEKERAVIKMVSTVLNVSPFGVNILGSLPYINKLGLSQKSNQYSKGKDEFKFNWIKRAMDDKEKAICECKIIRNGKDITDWVTGECSSVTMGMSTLNGYQNHMAQTRAKNRAIKEAYEVKIHEEMLENIGKLQEKKMISNQQAVALEITAANATSVSNEEIDEKKNIKEQKGNLTQDLFTYKSEVPTDIPQYECHNDGSPISKAQHDLTLKLYKKPLCRECIDGLKNR